MASTSSTSEPESKCGYCPSTRSVGAYCCPSAVASGKSNARRPLACHRHQAPRSDDLSGAVEEVVDALVVGPQEKRVRGTWQLVIDRQLDVRRRPSSEGRLDRFGRGQVRGLGKRRNQVVDGRSDLGRPEHLTAGVGVRVGDRAEPHEHAGRRETVPADHRVRVGRFAVAPCQVGGTSTTTRMASGPPVTFSRICRVAIDGAGVAVGAGVAAGVVGGCCVGVRAGVAVGGLVGLAVGAWVAAGPAHPAMKPITTAVIRVRFICPPIGP